MHLFHVQTIRFPKASRNRSTVDLHEYAVLAPAMFVNCTGNQLLPRSCFAEQQYGSISGCNSFYELQNVLERRTVSHNLREIYVAADFLFEVKILLGESLF